MRSMSVSCAAAVLVGIVQAVLDVLLAEPGAP